MRTAMTLALASVLAGVAAASTACVDRDIVRPAQVRPLNGDEIAAGLASANFRDVLAARTQLPSLPDDVWLTVLGPLARDAMPQRRLIVAIELPRRPLPQAREWLKILAEDPDETVRTQAVQSLDAAASLGGAP